MLIRPHGRERGVSIIEMMIAITIAALLLAIGLPNMAIWLNNSQIRTAGETLLAGLTLARVEAVRRNRIVRFQLVNEVASTCEISSSAGSWVVSLEDPSGNCHAAPSETVSPMIIQSRSASEGTSRATISAVTSANAPVGVAHFNGLGRITSPSGAANLSRIVIRNPTGGTCQHEDSTNGTMRCLRIDITAGGEVKMCDPAVTAADDPRRCA